MKINLLKEYNNVLQQNWITVGKDVQYALNNKILYLQCSASFSDWRHNLMFTKKPYDGGDNQYKGHKGFTLLWLSIKPIIEGLEFTSIVAYSQGGGIAHFIHENYYHRKGVEPLYTIGFGTPPTLWKYKGKPRFSRFYYVVNPLDVVFLLPFLLRYRPTGNIKRLKKRAKRPKGIGFFYWFSGHSPEEYIQRLKDEFLEV